MNRDVIFFKEAQTVRDAIQMFLSSGISGAPVVDSQKHLIGILSETDIIKKEAGVIDALKRASWANNNLNIQQLPTDLKKKPKTKRLLDTPIKDVMTRDPISIHPEMSIVEAAILMIKSEVNRFPVVEKGRVIGLLTRGDILQCMIWEILIAGSSTLEDDVAELFRKNHGTDDVDDEKPYAEFWMGSHPSGPSVLAEGGQSLQEWIEQHPEALGETVRQRFGNQLPFLLKVLSVRTALSIQSHPDKALAEKLHAEHPELYKDPNHKPEMAVALTDFEALCGFATLPEIATAFKDFPEMQRCVKGPSLDALRSATPMHAAKVLKEVFTELMLCPQETYNPAIDALIQRLTQKPAEDHSSREALLVRLNEQYPQDIGVFAACFLNYVTLKAGEAIYLPANEPHAYLMGDIVECMATSDNVIRAGLTPKLRDTTVLCNSLTYTMGRPTLLKGEDHVNGAIVYQPPFEEFEVRKIALAPNEEHELPTDQGPSLLLIHRGEGVMEATAPSKAPESVRCKSGDVYFLPSHVAAKIQGESDGLVIWQARVNSSLFKAVG